MSKEQVAAFKKELEEDLGRMYEAKMNQMGEKAWKKYVERKIEQELPLFLKSISNVDAAAQEYQSEDE